MSQQSQDHLQAKTGALLPAAARAVIGLYRPHLDPLQLTHPQYLVLLALENGQPRAVKEISETLALTPATMTPILKRLDKLDYISRSRDSTDERRLAVTLTGSGQALIPQLLNIRDRVNERVGLTQVERKQLQKFISSLPRET